MCGSLQQSEQQVFGADVVVFELLSFFLRRLKDLQRGWREMLLTQSGPLHLGELLNRLVDFDFEIVEIRTDLLQERRNDPFAVLNERSKQMPRLERLIAVARSNLLCVLDRFLGFESKLVEVHH